MEMQQLYLVVAVLLAIYQLALLIVFVVMVGLYRGQIIDILTFFPRQLQPEPEKSVVGEAVSTKVKETKAIPAIEQVETLQNNPESLKVQTREATLITESLSNEIPAENQVLEAPEPVSESKNIPAEVSPSSNKQLGMDEEKPKSPPESLPATIVDSTGNVTNKDLVCETEPLEIAEETIIPEESDTNIMPKHVEIRVLRGVNFPEAKDSHKYYLSMRVEEWCCQICDQDQKVKSKTIRGSQPGWNKDFTIKTQNPEGCLMTLKVKKSSRLGLKTSTVGFVKLYVSSLYDGLTELQLYDKDYNPVGDACLEVETKIKDLPEVIPSPAEVKREQRKMKGKMLLCQRHLNMYQAMRNPEI